MKFNHFRNLRATALMLACLVALHPITVATAAPKKKNKPKKGAAQAKVDDAKPLTEARTGQFKASFTEASKLASIRSVLGRTLSPQQKQQVGAKLGSKVLGSDTYAYDVRKEGWDIYVPNNYDSSVPYGLICYINSDNTSGLNKAWLPVLKKHRLIFACALNAGNTQDTLLRRIPLAVEAVHNLSKIYAIDKARIYISGGSGGGRASCIAMIGFSDVFTGGFPHVGTHCYKNIPAPKGGFYPAGISITSRSRFTQARQQNRYVFYTAAKDFNRKQTKDTYNIFRGDGFNCTYLEDPKGGHGKPNAAYFEKGIVALDAPLKAAARKQYDQAKSSEKRKAWGQAIESYRAAHAHGGDESFAQDAKQRHDALRAEYDKQVRAIRGAIDGRDFKTAMTRIARLRSSHRTMARDDITSLNAAMSKKRAEKK